MEEEKNIHDGHRERLMELAVKAGFENLSAIQKVEVVLCYIFPRGDVNPLAHRLLDRYKNLSTILEAPVEDLQMVKGIGRVAALKLHTLLNIYTDYLNDKMINQYKNATFGEICDYLESLLRFKRTEELHIIGINPKNEIVGDRCLAKGNVRLVAVEMRDIAYFVATYKVSAVILAHNHPYGSCHPSQQDLVSHERLASVFQFAGCRLLDNLIVGNDGIYSLEKKGVQRIFLDSEEAYNEAIKQLKNK